MNKQNYANVECKLRMNTFIIIVNWTKEKANKKYVNKYLMEYWLN